MRLLHIPRKLSEAIENANRSITELRFSVTSVLLPLKLLLWFCISIVAFDITYGNVHRESLAYRTITGAVDQLWYAIFYFSIPLLWQMCRDRIELMRHKCDWIVVQGDCTSVHDEDDWVII